MAELTPRRINSLARYMNGKAFRGWLPANHASTVWPSANLAMYIPFALPWSYTIQRLIWGNGGTIGGNVDIGIYSSVSGAPSARLASSGSTAQVGTGVLQYATLSSPLTLSAGEYFMGFAINSGTATTYLSAGIDTPKGKTMGLLQQAAAFVLPATATPVTWATTGYPMIGFTRASTGF